MRWLSSLTPVTYLSKLLGIHCVAAFTQLELFRGIFHKKIPVKTGIFLSYSSEDVCSSSGCFFLRSLFQILLSCPRQRRWILS
ncbi:hypothetical protein D5081_18825 [Pectobacterium carotovorum]|uniref:Uncharacterized protein n=1 Tax=Pectobacterium carotovorum TaxID=554 RepID=A0A419AEH1_PECCA|nr:hypothetical protein D5081_18825 [Pectobacterium carotovorum]RJL37579.1 hypothetical protein D5083_18465 [Pectobacterium carotovorum]RJL52338.1 hypothetical protein D5071_07985 [Pectobacterium carotovorum]